MNELAELLGRLDPARLAAVVSMLPPAAVYAVVAGADVALARVGEQLMTNVPPVHMACEHDAPQVPLELLAPDYAGGEHHRPNPVAEYTALQRARWPPNGDRAEWILYGPAGRPTAWVDLDPAAEPGPESKEAAA